MKPNQDRDVKKVLGLPMRWNSKKMFSNFWNRNDDRCFPPKQWGIGWDVNLHAMLKAMGIMGRGKK